MNLSPSNRLTPWVGRLIIANAVVLLLLMTVFTSPALQAALRFAPGEALQPPVDLRHLHVRPRGAAAPAGQHAHAVRVRPAGRAPARRPGVHSLLPVLRHRRGGALRWCSPASWPPRAHRRRVGRGAGRGRRVRACSGPTPSCSSSRCRCRSRRGPSSWSWSGSTSCSRSSTPNDGIAHLAHVGGAAFGYLFFRLQALSRRSPHPPPRAVERVVMVQSGAAEPEHRTPPAPIRPRRRAEADPVAAEVDRVLDKISEQGIDSLTAAERRFLDEVARAEEAGALSRTRRRTRPLASLASSPSAFVLSAPC